MKRFLILGSLAFAVCVAAQTAAAQETGAGCGLGKMLFDGKSGRSVNIAAAILNVFPIPNTFFMSTAATIDDELMGCDPRKTVQNEERQKVFVATNMDNLSRDMAQGSGPHLEVLASMMGIADVDKPSFFEMTQDEFANLDFSADDRMVAGLNSAMLERPELAKYIR